MISELRSVWIGIAVASVVVILLIYLLGDPFVDFVVGISWPLTVVIIVLIFRPQFARLIDRIIKISKGGAEFEPQSPPKDEPASPSPIAPPAGDRAAFTGVGGTKTSVEAAIAPVYQPLFKQLFMQAKDRFPHIRTLYAEPEIDVAIAVSAELATALHLERASRFIFKSQVDALDALKGRQVMKNDFKPYYDLGVQYAPSVYSDYTFDQWFNFLQLWQLVEAKDDAFAVTPAGEAISAYMATQRYALPAFA